MKKITAGQVHKALVDSIELRWKPLANGKHYNSVPSCQLCAAFDVTMIDSDKCKNCPLSLIEQGCVSSVSPWRNYRSAERRDDKIKAAENMIVQLQKCLDTFFPAGLAKK